MQSHELSEFIKKIPSLNNHFVGVFSIDTLPETIEDRKFLFCNTVPHTKIGEHWFCLSKVNNKIEVFECIEVDNTKKDLLNKFFKIKTKNKLKVNDTAVQSSTSTSCGLFALYFAINRFHNVDLGFKALLNEIFSSDVSLNEHLANEFCQIF